MSIFATNHIIEALATEWVKHFRRSPFITLSATFTAISIFVVVGLKVEEHQKEKLLAQRLENANFKSQIDQINEMETNVTQLLHFLEQQKATLSDTEQTISRLQTEKAKLAPLVETDRQVVEAIFRTQEERASASVWRERWIGFGLGIVASLVATFIGFVITKLARSQQNNGEQGGTGQPAIRPQSRDDQRP